MEKEKTNVMSQEELDELYEETGLTHEDFVQMLIDGEESRKNGTFRPAEEAFAELDRRIAERRAKYNNEMYFKKAS
jgi:hypothetical protein